jgi:outer membrane protein TolC
MTRTFSAPTVVLSLLLAACATAPNRSDDRRVAGAVAQAGAGAPRLPSAGDGFLDPTWFDQTLSADRAVQAALLNNPRVHAQLARLEAAQAERVQAGLLRNPMASLMVLRPEGGGRYELDYGLMQSLFDLFARTRRIAVANAAQQRVEADVIGTLAALAQETEAAYYEALAAAARLRVRQEQRDLETDSLRLLRAQASQGAVALSIALEQQALVDMQAQIAHSTEAEWAQSLAELAQQMGLPSARRLQLPNALPSATLPELDESALQALAARHRPDLQAVAAGVDEARAERTLQVGALRSTEPALGPSGVRESDGLSLNGLAVQISLPIFDTGQARRELADAQLAQAEFTAESVRRQAPLEVERALAMLVAMRQAATRADHRLRQQQQLEALARSNYEHGIIGVLDYRQASRARLASTLEQIEAQQAVWSAVVALQRATGVAVASNPDALRSE